MTTPTAPHADPDPEPDPIDQLIPPLRRWWVRLTVGLGIVLLAGFGSALVGFGYIYPRPDCCGSGSGSAPMTLTPDGQAVMVQAYVFNSSGRALDILWATAELPGARVLDVAFVDNADLVVPVRTRAWPATLRGTESARIAITFVPETCHTDVEDWGRVRLRLDVVNRWLPSIDRTYTLPDPVVGRGMNQLSVLPPDDDPRWSQLQDPLEAACALLGRSG
ncbi:MAG: hypothetical protein ABI949_17175 [Ilumatobacteraceae bacterium]